MGALLVRVGVERNVAVSFLNENGPGLAHIQGPVDGNDKSLSEAWVRFAAQTTRCADGFDNLQLANVLQAAIFSFHGLCETIDEGNAFG